MSAAMEDEFDTVASWTEQAVRELGAEYAMPAACRGSGSPAALTWLARSLRLDAAEQLLDVGAGVGGPSAFAAAFYGARPVLAEPMIGACRAASRLFGLPVTASTAQQLPFRDGVFPVAWCLGVLCTTTDKPAALQELRRVLRPGGRLGLLVFTQLVAELDEQPDGNEFPTERQLASLVSAAGFRVDDQADADDFDDPPPDWAQRAEAVEALIEQRHSHDSRWQTAHDQSAIMGHLIGSHRLRARLVVASRE
jgi:SAM-dependent methyltransferase